jgi:CheY-like chemotaxis protein
MKKMAQVHLLLVEDDEVDIMAVQRAFRERRLLNPITVAKDGIEALEFLRGTNGQAPLPRPFIVLLDLKMPRMDGLELLKEIRADESLKDSIVFVLTTSKHDEDIAAAYRHQVAGYILKSNAGLDFIRLIDLLDAYWRVVEVAV